MSKAPVKQRDPWVEIFRIVLMAMIVTVHGLNHGFGMGKLYSGVMPEESFPAFYFLLNSLCVVAVNCFFWISGYFGIRFRLKRILGMILECVFYCLVLELSAAVFIRHELGFGILPDALNEVRHIPEKYWFIPVYFAIYALSPFLNRGVRQLSTGEKKVLLAVLVGLNTLYGYMYGIAGMGSGFTLEQGLYLYITGMVCRDLREEKWVSGLSKNGGWGYLLCSAAIGGISWLYYRAGRPEDAWRMFNYHHPLLVASSVLLCLWVVGFRRKPGKLAQALGRMGKYTLSVYLITSYGFVLGNMYEPIESAMEILQISQTVTSLLLCAYAVAVTFACIGVDKVRSCLFDVLAKAARLDRVHERFCDKIKIPQIYR